MKRYSRLLLILVLLCQFFPPLLEAQERPRYMLVSSHVSFLFQNSETLPFQVIRPMCWDDNVGWCDAAMLNPDTPPVQIWMIIDFGEDRHGAIYQLGTECYWWMYKVEWGVDNNPHVDEHFWISCPVFAVN